MDLGSWSQILILGILLLGSCFFSASETALMSLSKIRVRHMLDENVKGAVLIDKLLEKKSKLLSTILIGNNIVNIGASSIATKLFMDLFGQSGVPVATLVMTVFVLIFGEITPKSLATQNSEKVSLIVSKPINIFVKIFTPIVWILNIITRYIIKLLGGNTNEVQPFITEEELRTILDVSHEEGVLEVEEKNMIKNVFEFGDLQAKDAMVQRTDIVGLDKDSTYGQILKTFKEQHFSRMPIYDDNIDDVVGMINVKDIIFVNEKDSFDIKDYMREPFYTYEYKKITELFAEMRKEKAHMSIVLDEYGGTAGIITMEDLLEEIVGDIEDEYDEEENEIQVIQNNEYVVDGSTRISLVNDMIGTNIESEEFDSIGGVLIGVLGRLPEQGEQVEYEKIKFVVESLDKNRIKKIRMFI